MPAIIRNIALLPYKNDIMLIDFMLRFVDKFNLTQIETFAILYIYNNLSSDDYYFGCSCIWSLKNMKQIQKRAGNYCLHYSFQLLQKIVQFCNDLEIPESDKKKTFNCDMMHQLETMNIEILRWEQFIKHKYISICIISSDNTKKPSKKNMENVYNKFVTSVTHDNNIVTNHKSLQTIRALSLLGIIPAWVQSYAKIQCTDPCMKYFINKHSTVKLTKLQIHSTIQSFISKLQKEMNIHLDMIGMYNFLIIFHNKTNESTEYPKRYLFQGQDDKFYENVLMHDVKNYKYDSRLIQKWWNGEEMVTSLHLHQSIGKNQLIETMFQTYSSATVRNERNYVFNNKMTFQQLYN